LQTTSEPERRWLRPLFLAALFFCVFHKFWAHGAYYRDSFFFMASNKYHIAEALGHWTIYWWGPWQLMGVPFAADPQTGSFYPLNLLFAFLPFGLAHKLFILLHYPLAAFTMDLFLRGKGLKRRPALLGGLAFALSGYMISQFGPVRMVLGAAWAPLVFYCMDRSLRERLIWAAAAGATLAAQVLAGDPETAYVTAILLVLYALGSAHALKNTARGLAATAVAAASSLGLAAVQIVPAWEMMRQSTRSGGLPLPDALAYSLHPAALLEVIWPTPFGVQWPQFTYWGKFMVDTEELLLPWCMSYYLGLPIIVLAGIGLTRGRRRFRLWLAAGLALFLLLSLGRYTPVYSWFHRLVPLFSSFRFPVKYMAWFTGFMAVAAALGAEKLEQWMSEKPAAAARSVAIYLAAVIAAIVAARWCWPLAVQQLGGFPPESTGYQEAMAHIHSGWIQWSAVGLAAGIIILGPARRIISPAHAMYLLIALLAFDLWLTNVTIMPAGPNDVFQRPSAAAMAISPGGRPPLGSFRIVREQVEFKDTNQSLTAYSFYERGCIFEWNTLKRNLDGLAGFEDLASYGSYELQLGRELYDRELNTSPKTMAVFNLEYVISPSGLGPITGVESKLIADDPANGFAVSRLAKAFPRAYWVPRAQKAADEKEALARFMSADHESTVIITTHGPIPETPPNDRRLVPAPVRDYQPDDVTIEVDAPAAGWLVLSDRNYPGWTAAVNGRPVPIYTANVLCRAVRVNAGRSIVRFSFRPLSIKIGAVITLICIALLVAWALYGRKQRPWPAAKIP